MKRRILIASVTAAMLAVGSGGGLVSAHERCVVNDHVVQVIANGQLEDDPAGYGTNPQGRDRGIRNARDHSPAIASCPED